jgi:hypothetical protein
MIPYHTQFAKPEFKSLRNLLEQAQTYPLYADNPKRRVELTSRRVRNVKSFAAFQKIRALHTTCPFPLRPIANVLL